MGGKFFRENGVFVLLGSGVSLLAPCAAFKINKCWCSLATLVTLYGRVKSCSILGRSCSILGRPCSILGRCSPILGNCGLFLALRGLFWAQGGPRLGAWGSRNPCPWRRQSSPAGAGTRGAFAGVRRGRTGPRGRAKFSLFYLAQVSRFQPFGRK